MMNPFDEIRASLSGLPNVRLNEQDGFIDAAPSADEGFPVSLLNEGTHFTVTYDNGWHEHIESATDALNCFGFGLSKWCRLKIFLAGEVPHKWTMEYCEAGHWVEDSTTGLILFPFWRARRMICKRNRITTNESGAEWRVC